MSATYCSGNQRWRIIAMFLIHKPTGVLVELLTPANLFDPYCKELIAQSHAGEELQDPCPFAKSEMTFPSGEPIPRCWLDPHYREFKKQPNFQQMALQVS
ncbi:MAG: acetyltransferase [Heteroscytonema crispum UTEX LB 1556]